MYLTCFCTRSSPSKPWDLCFHVIFIWLGCFLKAHLWYTFLSLFLKVSFFPSAVWSWIALLFLHRMWTLLHCCLPVSVAETRSLMFDELFSFLSYLLCLQEDCRIFSFTFEEVSLEYVPIPFLLSLTRISKLIIIIFIIILKKQVSLWLSKIFQPESWSFKIRGKKITTMPAFSPYIYLHASPKQQQKTIPPNHQINLQQYRE